jgi:hypothetical protein
MRRLMRLGANVTRVEDLRRARAVAKLEHSHAKITYLKDFGLALFLRSWGRDEMDHIAIINTKAWRCPGLTNTSSAAYHGTLE